MVSSFIFQKLSVGAHWAPPQTPPRFFLGYYVLGSNFGHFALDSRKNATCRWWWKKQVLATRVQSFGHNSNTNQDIKSQKSNLTSPISSKVDDIKMNLKVFDLHRHRLASLSNTINFPDVNLYNSQTIQLISLHLGGFLFGTSNSIFPDNYIKLAHCWDAIVPFDEGRGQM